MNEALSITSAPHPLRSGFESVQNLLRESCFALWQNSFYGRSDSRFSWDTCCSVYHAGGAPGGNWRCWDAVAGGFYTYERCCTFWPWNQGEDWSELPKHREPFLHFGLHTGVALIVVQASGGRRTSSEGILWRGGAALARWADEYADFWPGRRVLELAAGVGLPSAVAAYHGANVTITDVASASLRAAGQNARESSRQRGFGIGAGSSLARLDIRDPAAVQKFRRARGTFDVLLGSAFMATYWDRAPSARFRIWRSLSALLARCRGALIVVAVERDLLDELDAPKLRGDNASTLSQAPLQIAERDHAFVDHNGQQVQIAVLWRRPRDLSPCEIPRAEPQSGH